MVRYLKAGDHVRVTVKNGLSGYRPGWLEKNKEGLKKDRLHQEELQRFRTEATALLGI